jgi:hypothetical protein
MVTRFSQLEPPVWFWLQKTEPKLHLIWDLFLEPELEPGSSLGTGTKPGTCSRIGTRILENNIFLGKRKIGIRS